jgi:D-alanyl-D-alanine carboxypeptidase
VHQAGATGVLVETDSATEGRHRARAGVADLTTGEPVPWGAHVRIGSDTKTITAVVALQLVGEGVLDLDDTVEDWLPGLVRGNGNDGSRITLTNLLRHTSGLYDYTFVGVDFADFTYEHYRQTRFEVRNPAESVAPAFTEEPGWLPDADDPSAETTWGYSNTNYVLAQLIIEEATGNSWEQEVHERIIEPLGLRRTYAPGTSAYVPEPTARAYLQFPGDEELYDTTLAAGAHTGDGGVISTPAEYNRFLRALMGGELLAPEQLAAMKETVPTGDEDHLPGTGYGLGLSWAPRCAPERYEGRDGSEDAVDRADGFWFHGGSTLGAEAESGVTDDGSVAASSVAFSRWLHDTERDDRQWQAQLAMIDGALCDD